MDYLQYKSCHFFTSLPFFWVLNLIINGLPSILADMQGKSCYLGVLNLIINGLPSIPSKSIWRSCRNFKVLNLIINGLPSILITLWFSVHLSQ